jgi:HSP20 family molecular chaperone IbpA
LQPTEPIGVPALRLLARELYGTRDPADLFSHSRPIRLEKRDGRTVLEVDLPNASAGDVDVAAHGSELLIRMHDFQRRISLPTSLIGLPLAGVTLEKGVLEITFSPS